MSPGPLPAVWLAPAWLALGSRERAVEMLEIARGQGAPQYVYTFYVPRFAELRGERAAVNQRSAATAVLTAVATRTSARMLRS